MYVFVFVASVRYTCVAKRGKEKYIEKSVNSEFKSALRCDFYGLPVLPMCFIISFR